MRSAPLPRSEKERLERLRKYQILDTPSEDAFDRITRIVSTTLGVPISLVSLVDENRQWFKAKHGLDVEETPREIAFCAHAILDDKVFVVEDTLNDERFIDNPLVTGGPLIRFYAGAPLITSDGHNIGTLCAIDQVPREISEDDKLLLIDLATLVIDEMELRDALHASIEETDAAKAASHAKSQFLAAMSHEIRTPLAGVIGLTELVLGEDVSDIVRTYTQNAQSAAQGLIVILDEVLDISRIEANKMGVDMSAFSPRDLLKSTVEFFAPSAESKGLLLTSTVSNTVPDRIVTDPNRLRQIWLNLIGNAVKFTPAGSVSVELSFEDMFESDGMLVFIVSDDGIGIPEDKLVHIFDEFVQVDNSISRSFKGTGLGLTISKRVTHLLGGELFVASTEGHGATFTGSVPCRVERRSAVRVDQSPAGIVDAHALAQITILLAEDDKLMRDIAAAKLQKYCAKIEFSTNGIEAIDILKKGNIALIVMDVRMPEMDGITATRAIRALEGDISKTPIVGLTGDFVAQTIAECIDAGMNDVLPKPLDVQNFLEKTVPLLKP